MSTIRKPNRRPAAAQAMAAGTLAALEAAAVIRITHPVLPVPDSLSPGAAS